MNVRHLGRLTVVPGQPGAPVCGLPNYYDWMVTADPAKVTCKRCLRSRDYRMSGERRRRASEEAS